MRKLTISLLCIIMMFCTVFSVAASADDTQYGSITVTYKAGDKVFADMDVNAYKIADALTHTYFVLAAPFDSYPISIHNIQTQQEWDNLATTISGYIYADDLESDSMLGTDDEGVVVIGYLDPGIYFIPGITVQDGYAIYEFEPFFTYIPQRDLNNMWTYDVKVNPKWSSYTPQTDYSIVKLWKDTDNSQNRPQQVEVEIYKNGTLWQTQSLDSTNNWRYSWQAVADDTKWTVVEKNVPDGYNVSVTDNSGVFSIVNSYVPDPDPETPDPDPDTPKDTAHLPPEINIPNTGDISSTSLYVTLMCVSGLLLLILGIYCSRNNNEEN